MITTEFESVYSDRYAVNMVFQHLEFLTDKDEVDYIKCTLGWKAAVDSGLVEIFLAHMGTLLDCPIWFYGDPYGGSKPFDIKFLSLQPDASVDVYVKGKKSDRIQKKWVRQLAGALGYPVELHWIKKGGTK